MQLIREGAIEGYIATDHLTPNLDLVKCSKSWTEMKLTKAYPTLQPCADRQSLPSQRIEAVKTHRSGNPFADT